jgi:hypothetical protein
MPSVFDMPALNGFHFVKCLKNYLSDLKRPFVTGHRGAIEHELGMKVW